jgi:uncharacterized protein (TIGR03083 family)
LRTFVLDAAGDARAPRRHLANPLGPNLHPALVYARQWADLDALLDQLTADDWDANTSYDRPVRELLAHSVGVLEAFATELGVGTFRAPDEAGFDHWALTEPIMRPLLDRPPAATVAALREVNGRISAALMTLPDTEWSSLRTGLPLTVATRTRAISFELWMHSDDTRQATGRALVDPDAERLCALCDMAAGALSLAMLFAMPGRPWRLVLTGPGGGTWVSTDPGPAEATVVMSAPSYCRLAGKLVDLDEVDVLVEGDETFGRALLEAGRSFTV